MTTPKFKRKQKIELGNYGLSNAQIDALELTLPLSKAWVDAKPAPPVQSTRHALADFRRKLGSAIDAAHNLINDGSVSKDALLRSILPYLDQDDDAIVKAFFAMKDARDSVDSALDLLPAQTRKRSDTYILKRIDKALLDGFIKEHQKQGATLPAYKRIEPFNGGIYKKVVCIYFDALGWQEYPDQAVRKHVDWLASKKVDLT